MPILTAEDRIGTTLAEKYRIERVLGRGGMGVVFAGVHEWTSRAVAIKMLNPYFVSDEDVAERFLREAQSATKLDHPNVVDVLDMGRAEDGCVYLVLELLDGESLAEALEKRTTLPAAEAMELLLPVMEALSSAHEIGVIHRDLKPDNIFLDRDNRGRVVPKVLDFGIAKLLDPDSKVTATGNIVGTPKYMSPEQAHGRSDIGPAADVWSMGVVLFEALSGALPFEGESAIQILASVMSSEPKRLEEVAPDVPEPIAEAVDRALTEVDARFPSMAAFAAALLRAARHAGVSVEHDDAWIDDTLQRHSLIEEERASRASRVSTETPPAQRRRTWLALGAVGAVAVVLTAGWALTRPPSDEAGEQATAGPDGVEAAADPASDETDEPTTAALPPAEAPAPEVAEPDAGPAVALERARPARRSGSRPAMAMEPTPSEAMRDEPAVQRGANQAPIFR